MARNAFGVSASLGNQTFSSDWGDWRILLHPDSLTETYGRSGFFIHGGRNPGSAGCIDIGGGTFGNQETDRLKKDISECKLDKIKLTVE